MTVLRPVWRRLLPDGWSGRSASHVLLWSVVLLLCAWQIQRTPFVTDLTHFLPSRAGIAERILVDQMRQGQASRLVLVAIAGAEPAVLADASRRLAVALRADDAFVAVHNGSSEVSGESLDEVFRYRYLLSPDTNADAFGETGLRRALAARLDELASPLGLIERPWLTRDPTASLLHLLRDWQPADRPESREGVWFSRDGRRALMILETRAPGFDLGDQTSAVSRIGQSFEAIRAGRPLTLELAGPPVFSVAANRNIAREVAQLSALNGAAVLALLWLVYRRFGVVLLGSLPLLCGALAGTAAVGWWFGCVHGITLGFGATLIGVAADYPNHLFIHRTPHESPDHAVRRIWPTLRLGVLTNVAGFTAMLFSGFEGLAQLGLFAAVGLLTAGAAVRWLVPHLMPARVPIPDALLRTFARFPAARGRLGWVPLLAGSVAVVWLWRGPVALWNDDIDALNPVPEASKRLDESLRAELGAPDLRKLVIVQGADAESVLTASERLAEGLDPLVSAGLLQGYAMAARYLPSLHRQAERQAAIPPPEVLRERLARAQSGLAFRADAFAPFLAEAEAARTLPLLSPTAPLPELVRLQVGSLLFELGGRWVGLVPLRGVEDEWRLQQVLSATGLEAATYVDLRQESSRLLGGYRQEALHLLGWSSLAIVLLLVAGLRALTTALRVLLPMACAAVVTAAVMAGTSGLSLFHLVSLLLVMGLSLDQALFFNRAAEDHEERARTLLSLVLCNLSAVIAFGILATSSVNILHDIGATVALGAGLALLFAALLAGEVLPRARDA